MTGGANNSALDAETSSTGSNTSNAEFWCSDAQLGTAQSPALSTAENVATDGTQRDDSPAFLVRKLLPRHGPIPEFLDKETVHGDVSAGNIDYVHAVMDYMYAAATLKEKYLKKEKVAIISEDVGGFGDLLFGIKISRLVKDRLPMLETVRLYWKYDQDENRTSANLNVGADDVQIADIKAITDVDDFQNAIIIHGPTNGSALANEHNKDEGYDLIFMSEYGRQDLLCGADELQEGWRRAPAGAFSDEYGLLLEPPRRIEKLSLSQSNEVLAKHVSKGEYQFVYVHKFHAEVLSKLHDLSADGHPAPIVVAGGEKQLKTLLNDLEWMADELDVQYKFTNLSGEPKEKAFGKNGKAPVRKVYFQKMTNDQFVATMKDSLPVRIVTGDQSLSEALSMPDSVILYEKMPHKSQLLASLKTWTGGKLPVHGLFDKDNIARAQEDCTDPAMQDVLVSLQEKLTLQHRVVGAVKGAIFRRLKDKIRALDKEITQMAREERDLDAIYPKLRELATILKL